ncbi:MAG: hypothetical protein LAN71_07255 [Acidobacteriia bacterium]|nr:hypothetical protein [Terriglobia bacterium]
MPAIDWSLRPLEDELGEVLRAELLTWPGVTAKPMMGTLAFWHGRNMLGCYINRDLSKSKPEWMNAPGAPTFVCVRLRQQDARRALRRECVDEASFGFRSWVEVPLISRRHLEEAVRWLGVAYEHPAPKPKKRAARGKAKK